jgi:hypothetical protein
LFLVTNNQEIKDLNFTYAEVVAYAKFRKDAVPIVALQKPESII